MKRILFTLAVLLSASPQGGCHAAQNGSKEQQEMNTKKILVAFFSRAGENYAVGHIEQGNTHIVAEMIAAETGGSLFRIEPVESYPEDYTECTQVAREEKAAQARPAIRTDVAVEEYDVIFIGYPNWWGDMPMPVYTFIEKHRWQGKTVIPFCTHEGSGLSGTENRLKSVCGGSSVLKGLAVRGATAQNERETCRRQVAAWLKGLQF